MLGTTVPPAPADLDDRLGWAEHDVVGTADIRQDPSMDAVSEPERVEASSKLQFRERVTDTLALESSPVLVGTRDWPFRHLLWPNRRFGVGSVPCLMACQRLARRQADAGSWHLVARKGRSRS